MVSLYLDPNGENVFSHSLPTNHPTHTGHTTTNGYTNESAEEIISTLQARIKELESNKVTTQEVGSYFRTLNSGYKTYISKIKLSKEGQFPISQKVNYKNCNLLHPSLFSITILFHTFRGECNKSFLYFILEQD